VYTLGRYDITSLAALLFQHQAQAIVNGARSEGPRPHLIAREGIRSNRTPEAGLETLGDEVWQEPSPILGYGHTFPVLDDEILIVQIDICAGVWGPASAQLIGLIAYNRQGIVVALHRPEKRGHVARELPRRYFHTPKMPDWA
jgi:hypothetical protein